MVLMISGIVIIFLLVYFIAKLKAEIEDLQGKIVGLKAQLAIEKMWSRRKRKRIKTCKYKNYRIKK